MFLLSNKGGDSSPLSKEKGLSRHIPCKSGSQGGYIKSSQEVQSRPKFRELHFNRLSFRLVTSSIIFQQALASLYFGYDDIFLVQTECVRLVYEGISDSLATVLVTTSLGDDYGLYLTLDIHRLLAGCQAYKELLKMFKCD
jgi:hypothetical protein